MSCSRVQQARSRSRSRCSSCCHCSAASLPLRTPFDIGLSLVLSKEQQNANIIEWNIIYVLHLQSAVGSRTHMLHTTPVYVYGPGDSRNRRPLFPSTLSLPLSVIWGTFAYGMPPPMPTVAAAVSNSPVAFSAPLYFFSFAFLLLDARFSGKVAPSTHKYPLVSS